MEGISGSNIQNVVNNYFSGTGESSNADLSKKDLLEKIGMLIDMALAEGGPGAEDTVSAFADQFGKEFVNEVKDKIAEMDSIPQAKKDEIYEALDQALDLTGLDTEMEKGAIGGLITDIAGDAAKEEMEEVLNNTGGSTGSTSDKGGKEGAENSGGAGGAGGAEGAEGEGSSGNWLVDLAKAMASTAGKHLKEMIRLNKEVGAMEIEMDKKGADNVSGEDAEAFLQKTAAMQAHTQMFKMMQEAMTTVIKSVGEALNSTVRKQ